MEPIVCFSTLGIFWSAGGEAEVTWAGKIAFTKETERHLVISPYVSEIAPVDGFNFGTTYALTCLQGN